MYDPTTNTWSPLPKSPLRGREPAVTAWTGTELIIWGGQAVTDGQYLTDGATLGPLPAA
jgi:hypothetical protein